MWWSKYGTDCLSDRLLCSSCTFNILIVLLLSMECNIMTHCDMNPYGQICDQCAPGSMGEVEESLKRACRLSSTSPIEPGSELDATAHLCNWYQLGCILNSLHIPSS